MRNKTDIRYRLLYWIGIIAIPSLLASSYLYIIYSMMAKGASPSPVHMMQLRTLATVILGASIVAAGFVCYIVVTKISSHDLIKNLILSITVLFFLLAGAECFFLYYIQSDGIGERWSYRLWGKTNLTHRTTFNFINSRGDNDRADFREPIPVLRRKKKPIWFIGDSFTFGFGLEKTEQTFPSLIEQQLRMYQNVLNGDTENQIVCVNLGDGGADTYHEREILSAFDKSGHQKPSAIVWQYFGNDIDSADIGSRIYEKKMSNRKMEQFGRNFFRGKSFLLDYIYWEYFRQREQGDYNAYVDFLNRAYTADSIFVDGKALRDSTGNYINPFQSHLLPIKQAAEYYKGEGIKFLVIIFPYLWKGGPENSEKTYTRRLSAELKSDGIDVIDITPLVKGIQAEKRVVNSHDPHPSVMVHQLVADTIAKYFVTKYAM